MQIVRLEINNFRGIKELDWKISSSFICLLGPGDSCKSTILDAIDFALSPRWKLDIDDSDFYSVNPDSPISITVTLVGIAKDLLTEDAFGLHIRGWSSQQDLHDEPVGDDKEALSVRLTVGKSLEPIWTVVTDRNPEGARITSKQREYFGLNRVDSYVDRHLTWARGSLLTKITEGNSQSNAALVDASRAARDALKTCPLPRQSEASEKVQTASSGIGVAPKQSFRPMLDPKLLQMGSGGLSLHDGDVPMRLAGLGTRRLVALGIQLQQENAGVSLLDEVEYGLEPYRIRHLLRVLRAQTKKAGSPGKTDEGTADQKRQSEPRQVIFSTHSAVAIQELEVEELHIVRNRDGSVTVESVADEDLKTTIRRCPEALLSRKVLVCEGETEIGLVRALDIHWAAKAPSFAVKGIAVVDGEGSNIPARAKRLAKLGFDVAVLGDSDKELPSKAESLRILGVKVFMWEGAVCTEKRATLDLKWSGILRMVNAAFDAHDKDSVRASIKAYFKDAAIDGPVADWMDTPELRNAIGKASVSKDLFKSDRLGQTLGEIVTTEQKPGCEMSKTLEQLRNWVTI